MRRFLLFITVAVLAACTRDPLIPGLPRFRHEPPGHKPPSTADSVQTVTPGPHVWATAVRFPDGYDWEVDTCAVEGDVWLDLYCDGVPVRSVPAGESLSGDMHRSAGGHLYADRSTDKETVLYRDGEELFRFEGREAIRGFRVLEDGIHTLGQDRDGEGLTYRIDGREVFRSPVGTVFGDGDAFSESGGELCYCYCVKGDSRREFRLMREAELTGTAHPEGTVYDFRLVAGKACWVQFLKGSLTLVEDGKEKVLGLKSGEKVRSCRIFPGTDGLNLAVQVERNGIRHALVLTAGGSLFHLQDGVEAGPVLSDGEDTGWILTAQDGSRLFMRAQGISLSIPGNGFLYGDGCAAYSDGHLYLALSGRFGEPGRLVRDAEVTEIAFNGYFTSVTLEYNSYLWGMITRPNVKLNFGLRVLRRRSDGYHDLETLFVPYSGFNDTLEIITGDDYSRTSARLQETYSAEQMAQGISPDGKLMVTIARKEGVDWDPMKDLTARAYFLLSEGRDLPPMKIYLEKTSPVGAGLGGGSADAAFALRTIAELAGLDLSEAELAALAARLGSDCAFFIYNRPMLGTGRGEILEPFDIDLSGYRLEVTVPEGVAVSTADAYRGIVPAIPETPLREVLARPVEAWEGLLVNDFETTVFAKHPLLADIKASLYREGAVYASMSGSGSALFALWRR